MRLFVATLLVSFLLLSCGAKQPPQIIVVKVPDGYSGTIHIEPCTAGESEIVIADAQGHGKTALCPQGEVELSVIRDKTTVRIAAESVTVLTTGDGIPVDVIAKVQ